MGTIAVVLRDIITATEDPVAGWLLVFPTPTTGRLSVKSNSPTRRLSMTLVDATGKLVLTRLAVGQTELDLHDLTVGTYYLNIESEGEQATQKVLKQ